MPRRLCWLLVPVALSACMSKSDDDDDDDDEVADDTGADDTGADDTGDPGGDDTGDPGGDDTGGDDTGEPDDPSPSVVSGQVWCQPGSDTSAEFLILELVVDDPQGRHTIAAFDSAWRARDASSTLYEDALVCDYDGNCVASTRAALVPTTCADGGALSWEARILDEDGHDSGWVALSWVSR